jgi:hypothetical protein
MKFSIVHFHKQLEISGMPQSNRFLLTAQEGFSLEFDPATGGIIAKHVCLANALWLPAVSVAMAIIIPGTEVTQRDFDMQIEGVEAMKKKGKVARDSA